MSKNQKEQNIILGQKPGPEMKKDATHIALIPCEAAERLLPGQHVSLFRGKIYTEKGKKVGVVDPYLREPVEKGERFWLFLYQHSIIGLRHEYEHPDFPNESFKESKLEGGKKISDSQLYLNKVAEKLGITYEKLRDLVLGYLDGSDNHGFCLGNDRLDFETGDSRLEFWNDMCKPSYSLFWEHFEKVEGVSITDEQKDEAYIFRCAC